ncbi:MAG: hypothetical protein A2046_06760 [Bacteroidetes bacterium GWA2_30_7]|nr:MAG: hypothetical protein A2046_06760 [Bacteroidetes bacterium GWA2_30_7]
MKTLNLDIHKRYTYNDYVTWFDDVRRELFDGFIKLMSPSPTLKHQIISGNLYRNFSVYLQGKRCKVLYAPSDVRFIEKDTNEIYTVTQPDIYIVCDLTKLDAQGCLGSPDLIIEIISPKNAKRDVKDKFDLYEKYGVREYWIVNPNDENISVFLLDESGKYKLVRIYAGDDAIPVNIFDGALSIDLTEVFEE